MPTCHDRYNLGAPKRLWKKVHEDVADFVTHAVVREQTRRFAGSYPVQMSWESRWDGTSWRYLQGSAEGTPGTTIALDEAELREWLKGLVHSLANGDAGDVSLFFVDAASAGLFGRTVSVAETPRATSVRHIRVAPEASVTAQRIVQLVALGPADRRLQVLEAHSAREAAATEVKKAEATAQAARNASNNAERLRQRTAERAAREQREFQGKLQQVIQALEERDDDNMLAWRLPQAVAVELLQRATTEARRIRIYIEQVYL